MHGEFIELNTYIYILYFPANKSISMFHSGYLILVNAKYPEQDFKVISQQDVIFFSYPKINLTYPLFINSIHIGNLHYFLFPLRCLH